MICCIMRPLGVQLLHVAIVSAMVPALLSLDADTGHAADITWGNASSSLQLDTIASANSSVRDEHECPAALPIRGAECIKGNIVCKYNPASCPGTEQNTFEDAAECQSGLWVVGKTGSVCPGPQPREFLPQRPHVHKPFNSKARVFEAGKVGCVVYRTPSLVLLNSGELLAFSQCRQVSKEDFSPQEIRLKRSKDNGRTWSKQEKVAFSADPKHNRLHRAQTVHDAATDAIFLFDTPHPYPQKEPKICKIRIWRSDDAGRSWNAVATLTDPSQTGSGVASGIQLQGGKLVVVQRKGCNGHAGGGGAHALWSDDHGVSWSVGNATPRTDLGLSECQIAPLSNGSLLMLARAHGLDRVSTISTDQGRTWSAPRSVQALAGSAQCFGSLRAHKGDLFFAHPEGEHAKRKRLTIRRSRDDGGSWPAGAADSLVVHPGPSAYSCLGETWLGELAVLWESEGNLLFATTSHFDRQRRGGDHGRHRHGRRSPEETISFV